MSKAQFVAQFDELPLQAFVHIWFYYGQKKKFFCSYYYCFTQKAVEVKLMWTKHKNSSFICLNVTKC